MVKKKKRGLDFNVDYSVGFLDLLLILFIGLKLTGHIDWSWFWVMSPIWVTVCLIMVFLLGFFFTTLIAAIISIFISRWPK